MGVEIEPRRWAGVPVFITGHTGFKGSWLSLALARWGAEVSGYALAPDQSPDLFSLADISGHLLRHEVADVRDAERLSRSLQQAAPAVVFHMAAQPLVRRSYREPVDTWNTNVMGTVHLLEAVRRCPSVRAVVVVSSDKCYDNREWERGYVETDALGGRDPYSASKAATELVVRSYRDSFFAGTSTLLASARAGNVFGGGDFSEDRLIPDAIRALSRNEPLLIRHPQARRPWQHVLAALHGYVLLAQALLDGRQDAADAFNFGPDAQSNLAVGEVIAQLATHWPQLDYRTPGTDTGPHEAGLLHLDAGKAHRQLAWSPAWTFDEALARTAHWYSAWLDGQNVQGLTLAQIDGYFHG